MIYTIPKGEHYSKPRRYGIHFGRTEQKWLVKFDKSCLYKPDPQYNPWNKGTGWNYSLLNDKNSARWCWRPSLRQLGCLEVGAYLHVGGQKVEPDYNNVIILPESLDEYFSFELLNSPEEKLVYLDVNGEHISQVVATPGYLKPCIGWLHNFYMGGLNVALWDTTIEINPPATFEDWYL